MKWQDVNKKLVGSSIGIITLFTALFMLTGVSYTHSGDIVCDEECEAYINVTTSYWRICFDNYNDTKYSDETLFKKRTRSRTLHVNLDHVDNIISTEPRIEVDWLVPARGKGNWRPIKGGDCWERKKNNRIKLVAKKNASQTVKWSFILGDKVDIDPIFYGWKDNKISYENKDLTVKMKDALDKDLGEMTVGPHTSVDEIRPYGFGTWQVTMFYDFKDFKYIKDGLGEVIFIDKKINKTIEKDYYFVEWKEVDVPNYTVSCSENDLGNGTIIKNCEDIQIGTKKEFQWVNYTSNDIPGYDTRIGLKTYVGRGDLMDAQWNIVGKKVKKHITWTGDLFSGLVSYWTLNESSGNPSDLQGTNDLTATGVLYSQTGATINTATSIGFDTNTDKLEKINPTGVGSTTLSGTMWVNVTSIDNTFDTLFWIGKSGPTVRIQFNFRDTDLLEINAYDGSEDTAQTDYSSYFNTWAFIYWEVSATRFKVYINNVSKIDTAITYTTFSSAAKLQVGSNSDSGTRAINGKIDEVGLWSRTLSEAEITYLWSKSLYCPFGDDTCDITDTCTYSSGNWDVQFLDNCTVTDATNLGGNNLSLFGDVGRFDIRAAITSFGNVIKYGDADINIYSGGSLQQ